MEEVKRNLKTVEGFRWRKLNYQWVKLQQFSAVTLEPVISEFEEVNNCYFAKQEDNIAKLTLYKLKGNRFFLTFTIFSKLMLKAGNCYESFDVHFVPQFTVMDELEGSDSALPYLTRVLAGQIDVDLEGDNYLKLLVEKRKENSLSLPWNYDFLKTTITKLQAREYHQFYYDSINGVHMSLKKHVIKDYKEADISIYMDLKGELRKELKKKAKLKTMFSRKNCLELQLRGSIGEEEFFSGTIFNLVSRRGRYFEQGTRFEILTVEEMVQFTSEKSIFKESPHVYDTTITITTKVVLLIKSPKQVEKVRICELELPQNYVIGQILRALDGLDIEEEIPSSEDLTD